MTEASDLRCAMITDAIINDLPPAQACAVTHRYLHNVYRFPRDNYPDMLELAKKTIGVGLAVRGVY